jgi:hypothetical protein
MTEITKSVDKAGLPYKRATRLPWHCAGPKMSR